MQDVVAVVGHQHRILFVQVQNTAQRITLFGQQAHAFDVADQRQAVTFRQGGVRRVGHRAQQCQVQVQDPRQGTFVQGQAAGREQGQGYQVDRVDRRRFVEMARDLFTQARSGLVEPGRTELRGVGLFAPAGLLLVEEGAEADRFAEVHRHLAEALFERADDFEDVEDRLFLLARATQLTQVGAAFEHTFVADVHRYEDDRRAR
ncbi:hypothetical protein D3C77_443340 [compost metagenome]